MYTERWPRCWAYHIQGWYFKPIQGKSFSSIHFHQKLTYPKNKVILSLRQKSVAFVILYFPILKITQVTTTYFLVTGNFNCRIISQSWMKWYRMGSVQPDWGKNIHFRSCICMDAIEQRKYTMSLCLSILDFRDCISKGLSVKYLTADEVIDYIKQNGLYIKQNGHNPTDEWNFMLL